MIENRFKAIIWALCIPFFVLLAILCLLIEMDWKDLFARLWDTVRFLWNNKQEAE